MPRKKTTQSKKIRTIKAEKDESDKDKKENIPEKYYFAVGRRKTSVARIKLLEAEKAGEGDMIVNNRKMKDYFPSLMTQNIFLAPLKSTATIGRYKVQAKITGGGFRGQAEAARLAIARALVKTNEEFKKQLKDLGFLTRDARIVERKKAGLKKARRAPQWAKR